MGVFSRGVRLLAFTNAGFIDKKSAKKYFLIKDGQNSSRIIVFG
jgi:hypothetical protein